MLNMLKNLGIPAQSEITEAQYNEIHEKTGFNIVEFNEIVDLQNKLNERMGLDWKSQKFDWNLAMLVEGVELIDSVDWKWWKSSKTDWENLEIEMLDEFHFLIAKGIEDNQIALMSNILMAKEISHKEEESGVRDEELALQIIDIVKNKFLTSIQINNTLGAFLAWLDVWYLLGNDSQELFSKYKMKYTLNQFRQDNGYKTGEYKKVWFGEEDNVHVQKIAKTLKNDETFLDELYKQIEILYNKVPEIKEKSLDDFIRQDEKWSKFIVLIPEDNRKLMFEFAKEFQDYLGK